jgi:hypothetical protein
MAPVAGRDVCFQVSSYVPGNAKVMVVVGKALGQPPFFKMKSKGNGGDEVSQVNA